MSEVYSTHGRDAKFIQNLVENLKEKYYLVRPRRRYKENIKMHLAEIEYEDVVRINVAQVGTKGGLL
jgi:CRISPR/Cas system endoribonuclease Cas6 (RAMP superfamily)